LKKNILSDFFVKKPEYFTLLIIAVYFIIISSINSDFFSVDTMIRILFNGIMLFFITIGISAVIITKNIDVSVGSLMGLSATIGGTVLNQTNNATLAILTALGVGVLGGLFNGIGVAYLGVTAIIMTLGTMAIFRGLLIRWGVDSKCTRIFHQFFKTEIFGT
jgi:AI-2 transport system permease protein